MVDISNDSKSQKLESKLSEIELKEKEKRVQAQADDLGITYINLEKFPISQNALKTIEVEQANALQTICFLYTGEEMRLGSINPSNPQVNNLAKELAEKYHVRIKVYLISEASFNTAVAIYKKIPKIIQIEGVAISAEDIEKFDKQLTTFSELDEVIKKTGLTETINIIIAASLKFKASDIHIEAEENAVKVRLRMDGMLHEVANLKKESWPKISSRIKLLSGLKLNIGNKPQDGRFTIHLSEDKVDVRVSSIPSAFGESIVMRLLKSSSIGVEFEKLGFKGKSFNDLQEEMKKPNGMIITTGPTGSGKTTTLYAILNKLNTEDTKIITLEDPIEYKLAGIVQSQIDNADASDQEPTVAGETKKKSIYTFARGLRAILRQDPDVVMVGEIRDLETAETAINAALTGHLMLSTIHTNSAAGTIPRLLAMGVQPFLLAPSLNAVIGQRLARKLCPDCKVEDTKIDNTTMTTILNSLNEISPESGNKPELTNLKFYTAKGCDKCQELGYKGRIGIYEVMLMSPDIEKIILSGQSSEYEIEKVAVAAGMITMLQDGLLKAIEGITSIDEVFDKVKA
ncbi:MAG: type II/IV secretion system protein [Candidatus Komeilibacteria bacterium]|jgi:type IV pilus assembly protein PilB|nr:type II/IV secretion system protein [Candidatus Komeilibacteria bacterium]MBT4447509.1 type II/IV secretion system protein [Candidatus Komeilibacteria bacterium]